MRSIVWQHGSLPETLYVFAPAGRNTLAIFDPSSNSFVHIQRGVRRAGNSYENAYPTIRVIPVADPGSALQQRLLLLNFGASTAEFRSSIGSYAGSLPLGKKWLESKWQMLGRAEQEQRLADLERNTSFWMTSD